LEEPKHAEVNSIHWSLLMSPLVE